MNPAQLKRNSKLSGMRDRRALAAVTLLGPIAPDRNAEKTPKAVILNEREESNSLRAGSRFFAALRMTFFLELLQ
jgi:hypothetical protein